MCVLFTCYLSIYTYFICFFIYIKFRFVVVVLCSVQEFWIVLLAQLEMIERKTIYYITMYNRNEKMKRKLAREKNIYIKLCCI